MLEAKRQENIINDLLFYLRVKKEILFNSNKKCTQDAQYWILKDFSFIVSYLEKYIKHNKAVCKENLKPKGRILIILSYNEPLILSIVPVLNALIAGNEVVVKPSRRAYEIIKIIWIKSGIVKKYSLKLEIVRVPEISSLERLIESVVAVYFFGGYETGKKIAKICANYFVEFIPEIETADCMIIKYDNNKVISDKFIRSVLHQSFTHTGQSCQRIHGVYVYHKNYINFLKKIKNEFNKLCSSQAIEKYIDKNYQLNKSYYNEVHNDICNSGANEFICSKSKIPALVIKPNIDSVFMNNAYFLPILWFTVFSSLEELVEALRLRRFFLGLNIMSDDKILIKKIVSQTKYSRYTINSSHILIRDYEGWGGMWPSGFSGYKSWLYHFSNSYTKIEK